MGASFEMSTANCVARFVERDGMELFKRSPSTLNKNREN
jgi:hypothetical protein